MYFDRFDIVEAYHLWLTHYSSFNIAPDANYIRRCRLEERLGIVPAFNHSYEALTENGQFIYDQLEKNKFVSRYY